MIKIYAGGRIREYILEMSHMANKLKTMSMPLPDPFVVQLVFKDFSTSHVNYNTHPENRNVEKLYVEKLFTMCCQKVDRLKAANGDELVFHVQQKNKNYQNNKKFSHLVQIRRNMISVSQSDDDSIDCRFGDGKCAIQFNKECVGLAIRQDKSYLLSLPENKNASSYENVTKKRK